MAEIRHLRLIVESNTDQIARLMHALAEREASIADRDARIAELERSLSESRRSGKRQAAPFSKGDPKEEPARPGRRSGEAHGRHGHRLPPSAEPDKTVDVEMPGCCPDCGGEFDLERTADQYEAELPEVKPFVTRYRVPVGRCRSCGKRVQGRHPNQASDALGAAGSSVGPRAKAFAAWLHYGLGLSFAKSSALLARLGITAGPSAICQAAASTSKDLVPVSKGIVAKVNSSKAIVADETGWHVGGDSALLWVATSAEATCYWVADGRGYDEAAIVIDPDYDGVIVRDGWAPYRKFEKATHQTCLAHLLRRSHEMIADLPKSSRHVPEKVKAILQDALEARGLEGDELAEVIADLEERVEMLADGPHPNDENRKLVKHLWAEHTALFSFLKHEGVDATNWRAEQAIRPAVVNRKVWGGNRTWVGAETQGRIMSLLRTAAQRGIDPIDFLVCLARAPSPEMAPSLFS